MSLVVASPNHGVASDAPSAARAPETVKGAMKHANLTEFRTLAESETFAMNKGFSRWLDTRLGHP